MLALGRHDAGYVDAYYGPEAWKDEVEADASDLDATAAGAQDLLGRLAATDPGLDEIERLRHDFPS